MGELSGKNHAGKRQNWHGNWVAEERSRTAKYLSKNHRKPSQALVLVVLLVLVIASGAIEDALSRPPPRCAESQSCALSVDVERCRVRPNLVLRN